MQKIESRLSMSRPVPMQAQKRMEALHESLRVPGQFSVAFATTNCPGEFIILMHAKNRMTCRILAGRDCQTPGETPVARLQWSFLIADGFRLSPRQRW